jgi:hypothetical protein
MDDRQNFLLGEFAIRVLKLLKAGFDLLAGVTIFLDEGGFPAGTGA